MLNLDIEDTSQNMDDSKEFKKNHSLEGETGEHELSSEEESNYFKSLN